MFVAYFDADDNHDIKTQEVLDFHAAGTVMLSLALKRRNTVPEAHKVKIVFGPDSCPELVVNGISEAWVEG